MRTPLITEASNYTGTSGWNKPCNHELNDCNNYARAWIFDLIFHVFLIIIGTFGNLTVIASLIVQKKLNKNGNILIVNLAVADLIVSIVK